MKTAIKLWLLVAIWLGGLCRDCSGFALLGPYEPWMQSSNSYRLAGDIGGPMPLGSGYRWNVPVISYGFDEAFMDYFGTEGSNAVVAAIQTINDLPPASALVLSNYPSRVMMANYQAMAEGVIDLKSQTMSIVLEQLGLAEPMRSVFVLRRWNESLTVFSSEAEWELWYDDGKYMFYDGVYIYVRNYDPATLIPSHRVNTTLYTGTFINYNGQADILEIKIDPYASQLSAIADWGIEAGLYFTNYTRDDIGGLQYLLSSNNVAFEFLLPGVSGAGTNASSWVDGALRPGIEKLTLIPHPRDSGLGWLRFTNQFVDTFQTNSANVRQQLERVATQPDILFSVTNSRSRIQRTDTASWRNNAAVNGNTNGTGPGVIQPPIKLAFNQLGQSLSTQTPKPSYGWDLRKVCWGTFGANAATNQIMTFPVASYSGINQLKVNFTIFNNRKYFFRPIPTWQLPIPAGGVAVFQHSTNLLSWEDCCTITNTGGVVDWFHGSSGAQEFFRIVPQ